jgi:integrase
MRHTHVALLIEQGAHPSVIASRLGHTSVRTVLNVYGHLFEGLDRDITESLNAPSRLLVPSSANFRPGSGHRLSNEVA